MSVPSPWILAAERLAPEPWEPSGRPPLEPHQIPPPGKWPLWILLAGRGAGKTEACARYFAQWMRANPGHRGRIIAPSFGDAVESCIEGPSGLRSIDPDVRFVPSAPGGAKVFWPNGSEALVIGTWTPRDVERLRAGGNRHIDWWEEMAANPQLSYAWDQAEFGLRLGERPHSIASTTPRVVPKLKELLELPDTVVTRGTIDDNPHLPRARRDALKRRYAGTRLGRQELGGEMLEDVEGALWTRAMLDRAYDLRPRGGVIERGELRIERIVVAVDPATSSEPGSNETGIVVVCRDVNGMGGVLGDYSGIFTPNEWGRMVEEAYHRHRADRIIGERNNGGEMVEHVIRTVNPRLPYKPVWAARGKVARAEPISALYEQERIWHYDRWPELEDQLATFVPGASDSPDRLDALVWGFTELGIAAGAFAPPTVVQTGEPAMAGYDLEL